MINLVNHNGTQLEYTFNKWTPDFQFYFIYALFFNSCSNCWRKVSYQILLLLRPVELMPISFDGELTLQRLTIRPITKGPIIIV